MLNTNQNQVLPLVASAHIINVKNVSLRYKERIFLYSINIFMYLFILSGPLNYFFGINDRFLTAIAYFLLVSFILFFYSSPLLEKLNIFVIYFIFYILIRFFIEVFLMDTNWFQPFVSVLKFGSFSMMIWIFTNLKFSKLFIRKIQFSIFRFFIVTTMISILQSFKLPFYEIFSVYGGNFISGTILGNVRVNGGISGTVIDYAVLIIILNSLLFIIWETINRKQKIFFILIILCATFMNYSRVVFVLLPLLFFSFLISRRYNIKVSLSNFLIISIIILISIPVFFTFKNSFLPHVSYIFSYDVYRQASDQARVNMWIKGLESLDTPEKVLIGNSLGLNTGLPSVGKYKICADGHWVEAISDFGILGFFLYILIYVNVFFKLSRCDYGRKNKEMVTGLLIIIVLFNLVNSGFDHPLNMLILPIVFGIIINQEVDYTNR